MYLPPHFREDQLSAQHTLIQTYPLGTLISAGPGGLMANLVPFVLSSDASERGTLRCHLARANSQWQELAASPNCLVVFQGPQAYVTPTWYAAKQESGKVVPTWNYATVHVSGCARVIDDPSWLRCQIEELTRRSEAGRPTPWAVADAPSDFVDAQIRGIIGVEIPIGRIEGKWKMSQNRSKADRRGVFLGLQEEGGVSAAVANLVAQRGGLSR